MATDEKYDFYGDTLYGLGLYDVDCDLGQGIREDISAFRNEQRNIPIASYGSSPSVKRKSKKFAALSSLHRVATRSLSIQQTAQLSKPCSIKYGETVNLYFGVGEKLIIMFMYNNTCAVYRRSDATVAILTNAQFQGNPPAMLDGSKYGYLLNEVKFLLMYAVAKTDHSKQGLKFHQNDVILILAECRDTYVGITTRKRIGIFPSKLVQIITKRRMCIFNGMVLNMTINSSIILDGNYGNSNSGNDNTVYEVTKSSTGIFSWVSQDGHEISIHSLLEKALATESTNMENIYETVDEVSCRGKTLREKRKVPLPQPREGINSATQGDSSLKGEIWFHEDITRENAEQLLQEDGDFLVRYMSNCPWVYVLSCKTKTAYEHFRLRLNKRSYYHTNGGDFKSIRSLIHVHQAEGIPVSADPRTTIRRAVPNVNSQLYSLDEPYEDRYPSLSNSDTDIYTRHSTSESESEEEKILSKETSDKSSGLNETSEKELVSENDVYYEPTYIDEVRTLTEEMICLMSMLQPFLKPDGHPDNTKPKEPTFEITNRSEGNTDSTSERESVIEEPSERELPANDAEIGSEEQPGQERASENITSRPEREISKAEEMIQLKEEVNLLKSRLEMLMSQDADVQSQYLETYQPCKENEEGFEIPKGAEAEDDELYIDNVVECDKQEVPQKCLTPEEGEHLQRRFYLRQELQSFWQIEITDQLRDIVAMYLEPEFFHEVGKKLGVHRNRRSQIEREKTDIVDRTYELLGQWHQKQGHMATIGKLIETLEPFDPEDFNAILEEFYDEVEGNYSNFT